MTYDDKATSRLQGEQPESFHRDIAEMFPAAAGEYVTHDTLGDSFGGRDAYARVR